MEECSSLAPSLAHAQLSFLHRPDLPSWDGSVIHGGLAGLSQPNHQSRQSLRHSHMPVRLRQLCN